MVNKIVCIEDHTDIFGNSIYIGQVFSILNDYYENKQSYYVINGGYFAEKFFVELCIWRDIQIDKILSDEESCVY